MKSLACSLLFLLLVTAARAQNPFVIDSLEILLTLKSGADRYPPLYELTFEYLDRDNQRALEVIEEAVEAARISGDSLWIVKSMRVKAQILSRLERLSESIESGEEARRIAEGNGYSREQAMIMNSLAGCYAFNLRYDKSLEYYFAALDLSRLAGDSSLFAEALHNVGVVHYRLENYETGIRYLLKALATSQLIDEVQHYQLRSISLCYANLNRFVDAEYYLKESIKKCGPACSKLDIMKINFTQGLISYCKGDYQSASRQLFSIYRVSQDLNNIQFQLDIIHLLTEIKFKEKKLHEARTLLGDAEQLIAKGTGMNLEKLRIFNMQFRVYLAMGNYKQGSVYQNRYISLKDSLNNYDLTTKLMEVESEFKQRENNRIIAQQGEMLKLKEDVIARQNCLNILIGLLVLVSIAFLFLVFQSYRKNKRANVLLDQRIRDRTDELELSRYSLLNRLRQKDLLIDRASCRLRVQVSTLKALCRTANTEVTDSIALQYIERFDLASSMMEHYLFSLSMTTKD